jgi:hypothetical protein
LSQFRKYVSEGTAYRAGSSYGFIVNNNERMVAIMKNIIAHDGTFKPLSEKAHLAACEAYIPDKYLQ